MTEVVEIDDVIDKAIIKSFEYIEGKSIKGEGLYQKGIKRILHERFKIDDEDRIESRVRVLFNKGILIEKGQGISRKDKKKLYAVNMDMEFRYVCGLLPTEGESREIPTEIRHHHTEGLQDAIRTWIAFFPKPSAGYPFDSADRYQDDIRECQSHLLYPDLENHLQEMSYNVCNEWRKYKEDLLELQKMKEGLVSLVEDEISRCFKFKLIFISNLDDGINNYECNLIQKVLYSLVLDISGRIPEALADAYTYYYFTLSQFQEDSMLYSNLWRRDIITWRIKSVDIIMEVPKEELDALINGIENFNKLLENIVALPMTHLFKESKEIIEKVKKLKDNRDGMIKELEDTLQYYSFLGDCKYLAGY